MFFDPYLPDPFLMPDGHRITSADQWPRQAAYIRELLQEHMYGVWPGRTLSITEKDHRTEPAYDGKAIRESLILRVNGDFDLPVDFIHPAGAKDFPIFTFNCSYAWGRSVPTEKTLVCQGGYGVLTFDREQIRPDYSIAQHQGRLEEVMAAFFPTLSCCTLMAWGWEHTIAADWLEQQGYTGALICTGHSRGGKAALCAGIFDERFAVVAPIGSGCGGTGTSRFLGTTDGSRQDESRCETVGRITSVFPDWFSESYAAFGTAEKPNPITDCEARMPFDAHMLRAACAPRAVWNSEGYDDHWANPFGAELACRAADPVYALLGVPECNACHIRPGGHAFTEHDWTALADFCDVVLNRPRHNPHEDTTQRIFQIGLHNYAPWAE